MQDRTQRPSAQMAAFSYAQLPNPSAIRLLDILPGQGNDDVRFVLIEANLDDGLHDYNALSYTWGPARFPHTI